MDLDPTRGADDEPTPSSRTGTALCLSGGGYRAMLFHVGTLWRLNELGILPTLRRVSSVSGGSITAGALAFHWPRLDFDARGVARGFREVVEGVRRMARRTIDVAAALAAFVPGLTSAGRISAAYRAYLFEDATLQELPSDRHGPRFIFNATSVQTGALFRFSRPFMGDYRIGLVGEPRVALADAVAASSAFPPFLSPMRLSLAGTAFEPHTGSPEYATCRHEAVLTDGGVYDNLGLETAWKQCETILVSDGGGHLPAEPSPARDWARHLVRSLLLIDNQVGALRKRQLIAAFKAGVRAGTYFGIRTDIANYRLANAFHVPETRSLELANLPTRLSVVSENLQDRLINWGYAVCDAAVRAHVLHGALPPERLPYSGGI